MIDLYKILGVRRNSSQTNIKAAHRRLVKQYHPDTPDGDINKFREVDLAYKVLRDPKRRKKYDKDGEYSEQAELTVAQRVTTELVVLYTKAIEEGAVFRSEVDLIGTMKVIMQKSKAEHNKDLEATRKKRRLLKTIINKITRDDKKPNIFETTTLEHIRRCDDAVDHLTLAVQVCTEVGRELENYHSLSETIRFQGIYTGTTTTW